MKIEVSNYEEFCQVACQALTKDSPLAIVIKCDFILEGDASPTIFIADKDETDWRVKSIMSFAKGIIWVISRLQGRPGLENAMSRAKIAQCKVPQIWMEDLTVQAEEMQEHVKRSGVVGYIPIDLITDENSFKLRIQSMSMRPFKDGLEPRSQEEIPDGTAMESAKETASIRR